MSQPLSPSEFVDAFALLSRTVTLQVGGDVQATLRSAAERDIVGGAATGSTMVTIHGSQITGIPPARGNWISWDGRKRVIARVKTDGPRNEIVWYRLEVGG